MSRKKYLLNNTNNSKNKDNIEEKRISNYIFQSKRINEFTLFEEIYDNKNNFKKDYEIQNNSIIDEDEYNEEIYNNPISSFKYIFNDDNDDYNYKKNLSLNSSEEKSKVIFLFKTPKNSYHKEKDKLNSMETNSDKNYSFQDNSFFLNHNSKSLDKDNIIFMNIINNFEKSHQKLENIKNKNFTYEKNNKDSGVKRRYNNLKDKIISKFSIKKRRKMFSNNYNDIDKNTMFNSHSLNGIINKGKNLIKRNIEVNNENLNTESKEYKNSSNNNIRSIVKNLFNKNFPEVENNKNKDEKRVNSLIPNLGLNKKILQNTNNEVINSQVNNNNHDILSNMNYNTRMKYKNTDRKSKSMTNENCFLNKDYNKKLEKNNNIFQNTPKNIIRTKKVNFEEDLNEKEKNIFIKKLENENNRKINEYSNNNLINIQKNDFNKNYDILYSNDNSNIQDKNDINKNYNILYSRTNYNNKEININISNNNKRYKNYIFSNSSYKKDKGDNQNNNKNNNKYVLIRKNDNKNNENESNSNSYNNRRHNANIISPIKIESHKPIIKDKMINNKENSEKNNIRIYNSSKNNPQINIVHPKMNENSKIKIEKPSTPINGQNFIYKAKNINYDNFADNSYHIQNLKNQSINNQQNEDKIKSNDDDKNKLNLINCRSCFFKKEKIELFANDYNLNQDISNLNNKIFQNNKNINNIKKPIYQMSSSKTNDKTTYISKNDEISTERSNHTKYSITNKNDAEKYFINNSRSCTNYNYTNSRINNKEGKSNIKPIFTNTTNNSNYNQNYNNTNKNTLYLENTKFLNDEKSHQNAFHRSNHKIHEIKSTSTDKNIKINIINNLNNDKLNEKSKNNCQRIATCTSMENIRVLRRNIRNLNGTDINVTEMNNKENEKNNKNNLDNKIIYKNNLFHRYHVKKN